MKNPHFKYHLFFTTFALTSVVLLLVAQPWQRYGHRVIQWDVSLYYTYLPAAFIYHDIALTKEWPINLHDYQVGAKRFEHNRGVLKMSSGMAYLYLPAFAAGHVWASLSPLYEANGYSLPYHITLAIWVVFYSWAGSWFLFLFLRRYVRESAALMTIAVLLFGTNLLYYTHWDGAMSHSGTFALLSIALETCERYLNKQKWLFAVLIGLIGGLIVLIRPINLIPVAFIAFFYLRKLMEKKELNSTHLFLAAVTALLPWIPQLIYWKYITGSWLHYSYDGEGFYWLDAQWFNALFSWRKGWFVYTPVMIFSLIGFIQLYQKQRQWFLMLAPLLLIYLHVVFSWWCWWYGGSYGQRALIDIYPLLALPLALLMNDLLNKKLFVRISGFTIIVVLCMYNVFTTWQAAVSLMHYDSMTGKAYRAVFLKTNFPHEYDKLLSPPDYEGTLNRTTKDESTLD